MPISTLTCHNLMLIMPMETFTLMPLRLYTQDMVPRLATQTAMVQSRVIEYGVTNTSLLLVIGRVMMAGSLYKITTLMQVFGEGVGLRLQE